MRPNSLRPEFVISGAALLVTVAGLALAVAARFTSAFDDFDSGSLERLLETDISTGVAVLLLTVIVAVSYVLGAVVIQRTFEIFIGGKPDSVKARREHRRNARTVRRLSEVGRLRDAVHDLDPHRNYARQLLVRVLDDRHASIAEKLPDEKAELLFGIGLATATPDVAREIEYRRGNRQLFLGVVPSLWTASAASLLFWAARSPWWTWAAAAASLALGYLGTRILVRGAVYQEQLVQRHLLRSAVLSCGDDDAEPQKSAPRGRRRLWS